MKTLLSLSALCIALLSSGVRASERAETGWELIEKGALVVDVRTPAEFEQGHLDNAINYPLSEVATHFADIEKDQLIVLYCRSGNRSGQAYQFLRTQGFTQIHNAGGLIEMQENQ
ncbi:rhodanese-like domain-containing protein [Vibrio splendidus]|uniref:rhodanese-like domain-containing protein n=1 Tax=Vibrio splendidus TaxID=29497 RepID=UPI001C072168|nr:rhodanese-like domain-containing protein [Vibrio splendidus]MBU2911837.1 rhodanese-like domain-containing protein [Vibrio splendidus]MDO6531592.1 rhodanese-like domain-containing protein [Vibrio splendidus]MDO6551812.1 rhodanese-like domain-containing protein [Vibrio splendidus]